jgi:hypothetical protein
LPSSGQGTAAQQQQKTGEDVSIKMINSHDCVASPVVINFLRILLPAHFIWKIANTVTKTLKNLLKLPHVAELPTGCSAFLLSGIM